MILKTYEFEFEFCVSVSDVFVYIRDDMVFILMKRKYAKSFLLTFNQFFCFNNQVLNVLMQNSSGIREIKTKPAFVFIPLFQFSYHILQSTG